MSATLPKFDELKINKDVTFDYNNVHLIDDPIKYFSHPISIELKLKVNNRIRIR
jgi:hypothetical protein